MRYWKYAGKHYQHRPDWGNTILFTGGEDPPDGGRKPYSAGIILSRIANKIGPLGVLARAYRQR